jgi:hypothetical protein
MGLAGLGGGWRSFCEAVWIMIRIKGRVRKQRVSCQPSEGTPSTQLENSQSDVVAPYTGLEN